MKQSSLLYWIAGALIVIIVAWAALRGGGAQSSGPQGLVGRTAPSFRISTLAGGQAELASYRGRVVVMNLWASWCPPCRAEMPDLQRLYKTYASRGVVVIGVDEGESNTRAGSFAHSLGIQYPIWVDADEQYGRVYAALGMPTTVIVDRNGTVVRAFDGPLSFPQMTAALEPVLTH